MKEGAMIGGAERGRVILVSALPRLLTNSKREERIILVWPPGEMSG